MPRLRRVTHMCSRPISDPANRLRKTRKKKSSAVPLFRSGRRSPIFAGLSSKGKVGVQRGRKTAGCPSFLPTAVGTASSPPRGAARSRRPQTANPPLRFSEKLPARKGRTRLRQFVCPGFPVQKRSRPVRANTPAAVRVPRLSGAEKEPPCQGEHARAVRVPRSAGAENKAVLRLNCFFDNATAKRHTQAETA